MMNRQPTLVAWQTYQCFHRMHLTHSVPVTRQHLLKSKTQAKVLIGCLLLLLQRMMSSLQIQTQNQ
jgi:hypothetical protein